MVFIDMKNTQPALKVEVEPRRACYVSGDGIFEVKFEPPNLAGEHRNLNTMFPCCQRLASETLGEQHAKMHWERVCAHDLVARQLLAVGYHGDGGCLVGIAIHGDGTDLYQGTRIDHIF